MRQVTVDVRHAMISNTKTDIWRVDSIGEGRFRHAVRIFSICDSEGLRSIPHAAQGDGPTWVSFNGEIMVDDSGEDRSVQSRRAEGLKVCPAPRVVSIPPPDFVSLEGTAYCLPCRLPNHPNQSSRPCVRSFRLGLLLMHGPRMELDIGVHPSSSEYSVLGDFDAAATAFAI